MNSPTAVATASSTVAQVMDKVPDTLKNIMDVLSQKLGATGEALFRILIKQQIVYGTQEALGAALMTVALLVYWNKVHSPLMEKVDDDAGQTVMSVVAGLVSVILVIMICVNAVVSVGYFINPQYYAIQDLMKMVHGQ